AQQSLGEIASYRWLVDGVAVGAEDTLSHEFRGPGEVEIELTVTSASGATDTAALMVRVSYSEDLSCASEFRIFGPHGILIRDGESSRVADYRLAVPDAGAGNLGEVEWTLTPEGGEAVPLTSGSGGTTVRVEYDQEGSYSLAARLTVDGAEQVARWRVRVRTGAPFLDEEGQLLVSRLIRGEPWLLRYLDPASGFLSDPIGDYEGFDGYATCLEEGIFLTLYVEQGVQSLFVMNHDGTNLRRVLHREGSNFGMIDGRDGHVFLGEGLIGGTPLRFEVESGAWAYAKPDSRPEVTGLYPAAGPNGQTFALGFVKTEGTGQYDSYRMMILEKTADGWTMRPLHTESLNDAYPPWPGYAYPAVEGGYGAAWDPRDEFLAYTVYRGVNIDGWDYLDIGLARLDGSSVTLFAENGILPEWTRSGNHLFFSSLGEPPVGGLRPGHLRFVPRGGGTPVN
ncbi:MAG: hypothetical protein ACQET1_09930, partial [Gemmatimonadota bacterium]